MFQRFFRDVSENVQGFSKMFREINRFTKMFQRFVKDVSEIFGYVQRFSEIVSTDFQTLFTDWSDMFRVFRDEDQKSCRLSNSNYKI